MPTQAKQVAVTVKDTEGTYVDHIFRNAFNEARLSPEQAHLLSRRSKDLHKELIALFHRLVDTDP